MDPENGGPRAHPNYRERGRKRYHYTVETVAEIVGVRAETVRDSLGGRMGDLRAVSIWIAQRLLRRAGGEA